MKITELTTEMAQCAFDEFIDTWISTWVAARQLQDAHRTSYTYFKGYVASNSEEEGKR